MKAGIAFFLLLVPASPPFLWAAAAPRTLAIVDFPVRAPAALAAETEWLGAAVSELLQAKMQLFGGARVMERTRVRALVREAKIDPAAAGDDPAALAAVIPAEVLIAGKVEVAPLTQPSPAGGEGGRSGKIRVQARAFETETAKIISEATFSATADLSGLLQIAEQLARTLAAGLRLAYTQEQLAYAEPAKIDTLKFFVAGEGHLASGRHREAIASFQKALDGNEGRYYAAAHRLQGQAYQALAQASAGDEERKVREEYLKKFKEDALAAAGALYDLGLAYEANRMWEEAMQTYRDHIAAAGKEGERVRWTFTVRTDLRGMAQVNPQFFSTGIHGIIVEGESRLHFLSDSGPIVMRQSEFELAQEQVEIVTLDAATGKIVRTVDIRGLPEKPAAELKGSDYFLLGAQPAAFYVGWQHRYRHGFSDHPHRGDPWLAAIAPSGEPLWRKRLGTPETELTSWNCTGERIYLTVEEREPPEERHLSGNDRHRVQRFFLTLDTRGEVLSRIPISPDKQNARSILMGLDQASGSLTVGKRTFDLASGATIASAAPPTGHPGVTSIEDREGVTFYKNGEKAFVAKGYALVTDAPPKVNDGPLVLRRLQGPGYAILRPRDWMLTPLYEGYRGREVPRYLTHNREIVVFSLKVSGKGGEGDMRFGLPLPEEGEVLNLFDATSGVLLVRNQAPREFGDVVHMAGRDLIYRTHVGLGRINLAPDRRSQVAHAERAHLGIARCLTGQGRLDEALQELALFDAAFPDDKESYLLRMRISDLRGDRGAGATLAFKVLGSGFATGGETEECLRLIRRERPEVRAAIKAPLRGVVQFRSMPDPNTIVGFVAGKEAFLLIDTESNKARLVSPPLQKPLSTREEAPEMRRLICRSWDLNLLPTGPIAKAGLPAKQREKVDPMSGFTHPCGSAPPLFLADNGNRQRLLMVDPETLQAQEEIPLPDRGYQVRYPGEEAVVLHHPGKGTMSLDFTLFTAGREEPLIVADPPRSEAVRDLRVRLQSEKVVAAAADHTALLVGICGADFEKYLYGGRASWIRIESLPLGPDGRKWSFEAEGWLAGNLVIDGDEIVFPAHDGPLPAPAIREEASAEIWVVPGNMPLKRIRLDRRTGHRVGEEPLRVEPWDSPSGGTDMASLWRSQDLCDETRMGGLFVPAAPRRIFAKTSVSLFEYSLFSSALDAYWSGGPGRRPLKLLAADNGSYVIPVIPGYESYDEQVGSGPNALVLARGDTVYESIGGGVILVKELGDGAGADALRLRYRKRR